MAEKEVKKPTIRYISHKAGVYAYTIHVPVQCFVTAPTKNEAIAAIKAEHPGEYEIVSIAEDNKKRHEYLAAKKASERPAMELTSEERMEVAAEMSKL